MTELTTGHRRNYDLLGIFLSTLCGIHCLVTPLALLYIPSVGEHLESPWVHALLIGFVALAFHQSVYSHYKFHRSKTTLGVGLLGFAILLTTTLFEVFAHSHEQGHGDGHQEEGAMLYLALVGAILLITSHILNIRKCQCLTNNGLCVKSTEGDSIHRRS